VLDNFRTLRSSTPFVGDDAKHDNNYLMWANGQRNGLPIEYRWRPLFNAAKFGWRPLTRVLCSNGAKTRNPLKFAGVPQTRQQISAVSRPKFAILWGMWRRYRCLKSFFPIVDTCLSCEDTARQICAMVPKWRFFASCISASRVQQVLDLHPKSALRPHHVCKYGRHPICDGWD